MSRSVQTGIGDAPSTDPTDEVPWSSPVVRVVVPSMALAPMGVPLISPTLPVLRDVLGLTDARASLVISSFFVVGIVLSPFIGLLADQIGRKQVLVASLLVFSLGGRMIATAPPFTVVLALRLVQGAAAAGVFITTVTLIRDTFDGARRTAVFGVSIAVLSAGAAVYPLVGGALAAVAWNVPFLPFFAGIPLAIYTAYVLPDRRIEASPRGLEYLRRAARALRWRPAVVLYGTAFVTEVLLFGAVYTALPFLLTESYGLTAVTVGLGIGAVEVASTVASARTGRLARLLTNTQLVFVGYVCYAVGLTGAGLATSPVLIVAAVVVLGVGVGLSMPAVDAAVGDLVPTAVRSGALSLRNSTTFLGRAIGPILFASAATGNVGYPRALLLGGIGAAVCAVFLFGLSRRSVTAEDDRTDEP